MSKKTQIVIASAAVIFTIFFTWSALTYDGASTGNNTNGNNVSQNAGNQTSQKDGDGAKIVNSENTKNPAQPAGNIADKNKNGDSDDKDSEEPAKDNNKTDQSSIDDETGEYTVYEVKKGDTLLSISREYAETSPTSVVSTAILKANNLSSGSSIKQGMKLKIPVKYSNGSKYVVRNGDSLFTIAALNMRDLDVFEAIAKIKKDNFLTSDNIKINDVLFLADVSEIKHRDSTTSYSNNKNPDDKEKITNDTSLDNLDFVSYTVKKGDTIKSIVKQYEDYCPPSVASKIILKINKLSSSSEIKEGLTLKIPEDYLKSGEKYTVQFGDTLTGIAVSYLKDMEMFKAVEKIMKDNFLTSDGIKTGDEIFIVATDLGL
jgi:LysM repeat protein